MEYGVYITVKEIGYHKFVCDGFMMRKCLIELYSRGVPLSAIHFYFPLGG